MILNRICYKIIDLFSLRGINWTNPLLKIGATSKLHQTKGDPSQVLNTSKDGDFFPLLNPTSISLTATAAFSSPVVHLREACLIFYINTH